MDFLEEFDKRARKPQPPGNAPRDEDAELLDFAERIRATRALPSDGERERIFKRVKMSEAAAARANATSPSQTDSTETPFTVVAIPVVVPPAPKAPARLSEAQIARRRWRSFATSMVAGIAALVALFFGGVALTNLFQTPPIATKGDAPPVILKDTPAVAIAQDAATRDDFANVQFPKAILASSDSGAAAVLEVSHGESPARALRVHGLVVFQAKGETRWHVLKRGQTLQAGDVLRASLRLESGARILAPDGSAVSFGPGAILHYAGPRAWTLDEGAAQFEVAARPDLAAFKVATPDGTAQALGTRFLLDVSKRDANEPKKNATRCVVGEGKIEVAARNAQTKKLGVNESAFLNSEGVVTAEGSSKQAWLAALENELNNDRGIGQLVAKTEKANEHLPLEIASHSVSVTCVDQVARTFVDEIFVNNTDRELEGTFYYPLPADAAIDEFAMYVNGKRIVGEVLEQNKARQVYEYIVRQQKDPALLEWAGGNLFKMRVYPIEAHSQKHIQLGYTQILPRRNGTVTYTYPLYSEMLLKNPLQNLSIEFRVLSDVGLSDLASPSHVAGVALDPDGKRGTLAFRAQKYSPTRDFSVTYKVPDSAECVATANAHPDDKDPYFMLQFCPKTALPPRKAPERVLVIVDGSASAGAQDYSVATEFAASCADVSSNWKIGLLRGGQNAEPIDLQMTRTATPTGGIEFVFPDENTSTIARNSLNNKFALGATDLLVTFQKAAQYAADGKGLQIVYVGDGIDTLNELSGSALVERITALFAGKDVHVSTVAIGSSYERPVLQGLAAALGGTFTRVEGAADVHAAVDQVFDSFYRPQFWNARVKIEGVETSDVHSEIIGTLAAGDTAILLGRFKKPASVNIAFASLPTRATFSAEIDGGIFQRQYPIQLLVEDGRNNFLPRLWARAHNEALLAQMGLGGSSEDARVKKEVTENSVKFQIMSPYTSFLVLDSEEAYAKYGIKRSMKRVDWMGGELAQKHEAPRSGRFKNPMFYDYEANFGDIDTFSGSFGGDLGGEFELNESNYLGREVRRMTSKDRLLSLADVPNPGVSMPTGNAWGFDGERDESLGLDLGNASAVDQLGEQFEELEEAAVESDTDDAKAIVGDHFEINRAKQQQQQGLNGLEARRQSYYFRRGFNRYGNPYQYFASSIFPNEKSVNLGGTPAVTFEFTPDRPLKGAAHYQRIVARNPGDYAARMNWVLSLEAEENFKRALNEIALLVGIFPNSAELKLEQGFLLARDGDAVRSAPAMDAALKLLDKSAQAAMAERIAATLGAGGLYDQAAQRYSDLARNAAKGDDAARLANLASNSWLYAHAAEKCAPFWEEMYTRWPDVAAINSGAGQWLSLHAPKDKRGLSLLRKAAGEDVKYAPGLIGALIGLHQRDEALSEARRFLDLDKSQTNTFALLVSLMPLRNGVAVGEAKRLLKGKFSYGQYAGIVQFVTNFNLKNDKELVQLISANLKTNLTSYVAYTLANYNLAGMTPEKMSAVFVSELTARIHTDQKVLTPDEYNLVSNAISLLIQHAKHFEADGIIRAALWQGIFNSDKERRFPLIAYEYNVLVALNREAEFFERYNAEFFGDNPTAPEKQIAALTDTMLWNLQNKHDLDGAAERVAAFGKRFPDSAALPQLHGHVLQVLMAIQKPAERDAAIERLSKKYPADLYYLDLRARSLAQKGNIRDAAELIRGALTVQPRVNSQTVALLNLLARLSAQDAELREAFFKEAEAKAKTQDPVLREWTEAMLTCLHDAGDQDKYLSALSVRAALEPADLEWTPRMGSALIEAGKYKEARAVFEALSNANLDDANLAFTCRELCVKLKDEKAAQAYFDRAFEALAARPNKLSQFAAEHQGDNPEWALKAYARMGQDPKHFPLNSYALNAANVARDMGRTDVAIDWYFKTLFAADSYYISAAANELAVFAQQEANFRVIEPRVRAALLEKRGAFDAIAAHVLLAKLKKLKNDTAGVHAELDAAMAIDLPQQNESYAVAAIFEGLAGENLRDKIETYALKGGGAISADQRRQMVRSAINYVDAPGTIRLYRVLLQDPDSNGEWDRAQLVDRLIGNKELDAALIEVRKFDSTANLDSAWRGWDRVVNAYHDTKNDVKAVAVALEMWAIFKDDPQYGASLVRIPIDVAYHADKKAKPIDPAAVKQIAAAYLSCVKLFFEGDETHRYDFEHSSYAIGFLGLKAEIDALAKHAETSGDPRRINAAAVYAYNQKHYSDARSIYERALSRDPKNSVALQAVYDICAHHVTDWETALKTLDTLEALKANDEVWLKTERVRCLYGLKRTEDARKVCRELMKLPSYTRYGYSNMQYLARDCETAKDFAMAVEVWELALRYLRAQSARQLDSSSAAQFYTACGKAYAQNGEEAKALDCFLRGLSIIPRTDSNYKTVLQAALDNALKGKSLAQAVAAHENNVASDGSDKPHLRIAFAEAFKKENKPRDMLAQMRIAADLLPKDMALRKEVIEGFKQLKDTDAAIDEYRRWSALDPQNIELYRGWGDLYESMGRRGDAILAWATMAEVRPREAEGYRAYGQKLAAIGEREKAASAFRQALKYRPTEYDIAKELAEEYRKQDAVAGNARIGKLWTDGENACRKAMEDVEDDPLPWLNLGRFLEAQRKVKEARELYERIAVRAWPRFRNETMTEARKRLVEMK